MKNSLLTLLFLLGLSCQAFAQTPAKGFEGSWQGTLEAGGTKLRLVLTVTKSDAGAYAGKVDSLDQGATIPIDIITVNGDAVRLEVKSTPTAIVFIGGKAVGRLIGDDWRTPEVELARLVAAHR